MACVGCLNNVTTGKKCPLCKDEINDFIILGKPKFDLKYINCVDCEEQITDRVRILTHLKILSHSININ